LKQTLHTDRECKEGNKEGGGPTEDSVCEWVEATVGMKGNELADRLAKKAVANDRSIWVR